MVASSVLYGFVEADMGKDDLKSLPVDVKVLVNDGVYSIYSVKNPQDFAYVLVTDKQKLYALSTDGDIVAGVVLKQLSDVELGALVHFPGLDPRQTLKLNYA